MVASGGNEVQVSWGCLEAQPPPHAALLGRSAVSQAGVPPSNGTEVTLGFQKASGGGKGPLLVKGTPVFYKTATGTQWEL